MVCHTLVKLYVNRVAFYRENSFLHMGVKSIFEQTLLFVLNIQLLLEMHRPIKFQ